MKRTCGEFGGQNAKGEPCRQHPGAGTDHKGKGRCHRHTDEALATMQAQKTRVLEILADQFGSLTKAAHELDVDAVTLWRWRQTDEAFDRAVNEAVEDAEPRRVQMVEDALYVRCLKGKASAAEVIFYLINRGGGRWKHVQRYEHTGKDGAAIKTEHDLSKLSDTQLTQLERLVRTSAVAN